MKFPASHGLVIMALAMALTAPAILSPPMTHDSFWISWTWADQFTSELAKGNLYPRWLPQSHGGLGSPAFYFYPPLAFYVTGVFGLAGLSTYASIVAAIFAGFAASGLAMHAWLKDSAKAPLLGALLFMAAPYHVLDIYGRGALAEFLAMALIPLLALGLRRAAEGRFVLGALAYGAMILTHLPLALLVSLFFVVPYSLLLSRAAPKKLLRIAIPILLGLAVSAIYLLPALALEPHRDTAAFWELATFKAENWSLLRWGAPGPSPDMRSAVAAVILTLGYASFVLLFAGQRKWGGYAALCCVLAAGLIPGFWTLPLLETVQFPFRVLPLAEFAIATGIAHLGVARPLVYAAALPMLAPSALFLLVQPKHPEVTMEQLIADHPDVPENLPPGDRPYSWPSRWALDVAKAHPQPRQIGDLMVDRLFYFPAWEVRCQGRPVPTAPEPDTKLLTYRGSGCERRLVLTAPERIGAAVSLAGILVLFGLAGLARSRSQRSNVDDPVLV